MKTLLVIGIGTGHPEHLTVEAVNALNRVEVFLTLDKGPDKHALGQLRRAICERYIKAPGYRVVTVDNPTRSPAQPGYRASVEQVNQARLQLFEDFVDQQLADGACGGLLVWGDPSLYDSTLRILATLAARPGKPLDYQVIPGISSVQLLAARHRLPLNSIGGAVTITTGRRVHEQGLGAELDSVVVMLDAIDAYTGLRGQGWQMHWGAYLGSPEEVLRAGPLEPLADELPALRQRLRQAHGWIMDSYLLTRRRS